MALFDKWKNGSMAMGQQPTYDMVGGCLPFRDLSQWDGYILGRSDYLNYTMGHDRLKTIRGIFFGGLLFGHIWGA